MFFILLLPLTILLTKLSRIFPDFIETYYSSFFYKIIASILSEITGFIPFSLAELIIIHFCVFSLFHVLKIFILIYKFENRRSEILKNFGFNVLATSGIIYFSFQMLWGFNYQRLSLDKLLKLDIRVSSSTEVVELCNTLIKSSNSLRKNLKENKDGLMELPYNNSYILKTAYLGYDETSLKYPKLGGNYGPPKTIFFSLPMSYTGITGFYFPFTSEANISTAEFDSSLPFTTEHEMAHQRGFAKEDEANYIAYVTCINHPDVYFKYSGTLSALTYSLNELQKIDNEKFEELLFSCTSGVLNDLNYKKRIWKGYSGAIESIGNAVNDSYLKSQNQNSGTKSYGEMVDLLLAEQRKKQS